MKQFFLLVCSLFLLMAAQGQADSSAAADTVPERSTFTLGISAANNASYYGQKSKEKMAYGAVVGAYRHRSGLYLNGLAYRLLNDSATFASAYGAGGGIVFKLGKKLSADLGYNYTFYPKHSPFLQAANPHTANLTITHEGWLSTSFGADYSFGKTNDVFTTLGLGKSINLFSISNKDIVAIVPLLDVTAGTQRFYSHYIVEKNIRDSILDGLFPPGNEEEEEIHTTTTTSFDILSYNFKLPLSYSRASYMIELSSQLSLLSNKAQSDPGKLNSFFTASFYYQF